MSPQPLLRVTGKDCSCGHPLVWHKGRQWCAVYGSHTMQSSNRHGRTDPDAPLGWLVDLLDAMTPRRGKARAA